MSTTVEGTVEYKELVGHGRTGDFVLEQQGAAEGFKNISSLWLPQTITFDQAIENLERERSNREDIVSKWEDWEFALDNQELVLKNKEGRSFKPTEHAINQAAGYSEVQPSFIAKTLSEEFEADETDLSQLVGMLNYRKQRHHQTNKGDDRKLIFRTYNDNTLRAVLTEMYSPVDNRWFLEVLKSLIKDGRVSHQRGDADCLSANILIPDSVRFDKDSDYGGLFAVKNSEIGTAALDVCPSLFRSICMNGCIRDITLGVNLRTVHKGKIDLSVLSVAIAENLNAQIKIMPELLDEFLALRKYEFSNVLMTGVFASVAERFKLTTKEIQDTMSEFAKNEKDNRNVFGLINSITRAGQNYSYQDTERFDRIGGLMVDANWDSLVSTAKSYSEKELTKILGLAV